MALKDRLYGLIIATTGYNGNNLLFRHPPISQKCSKHDGENFPYALKSSSFHDDNQHYNVAYSDSMSKNLDHYSDEVLANLLVGGKSDFCERGFNLQIENVVFVGCTKRISPAPQNHQKSDLDVMSISFAISSTAERYSAVLQKLAHQISTAVVREKKHSLARTESSDNFEYGCQTPIGKFLRRVYEAVETDSWVDVHLNNWIRVHCFLADDNSSTDDKSAILNAMKPYHTLILLKSEKFIASRCVFHCSPSLAAFLRCYSPSRSFMSIASDSMMTPGHVKEIASALVAWGYAEIIYPINDSNVYAVCPRLDVKNLFEAFNAEFGAGMSSNFTLTLVDALVEFSVPADLKDHRDALLDFVRDTDAQDSAMTFQKIFIWLLKNKALYQVHTYIYLIHDQIDSSLAIDTNLSMDLAASVKSDEGGEDFSNLSNCSEKPAWLNNLEDFSISSRNSVCGYEDEKLFHRAKKYFNGRYNFEEILFLEKIPRSVFLTLVDKYRYKLLLWEHEDPSICKL